ncbi:diguanylate cyclase [Leptolyngbya sp. CCNP1308]|uniref:diguanylate cyclase n=1 Tax=Leptolyngbya sp. CCNP1308 TaxID=3110255 RepID=UPI002B1E9E25|nr:diguanylate cyclase [Leptolyngbya sp. CCNP1308]MEA5450114.1 diguanylate cyclase [Leptolyngbya sp. CCNP1308]
MAELDDLRRLVQRLQAENADLQQIAALQQVNQPVQNALGRSPPSLPEAVSPFEAFMAHAPAIAWMTDANGVMGYANSAWLTLFGLSAQQVIGQTLEALFPPAIAQDYRQNNQWVLDHQAVFETIEQAILPDGTTRIFLVRKFPIYPAGAATRWVGGIGVDITELKHTEAALRNSEATNRAMLKAIPDLPLRVGSDGTCYDFRAPANAVEGMSVPIRHHISEVLPPELLAHQLQRIEQALATGTLQVWERQFEKYGKMLYEEVRLIRCGDDECLAIVRDISDRKAVELALKTKTEELERFFSVVLDLLCISDTEGYFHRLNHAWEKILGYPLAVLENARSLDYVHPEDLDSTLESIAKLNRQQEIINFVNRYRCQDGSYRWLEWRAVPVGDQVYATARDITLRRQAELELESTKLQLTGVLDSSLDGIMAFQSVRNEADTLVDFEWLLSNPAACELVGRTAEYLVGKRLLEEMPGNRTDGLFDLYVDVVSSGDALQRQFHYTHDGLSTWFEIGAVKLGDGFAVTFRNITPLKQVAQALQQANQQLETRVAELDQRNREMQLLGEMSDFLQACITKEEAYQALPNLIEPLFPDSMGGIFIIDNSRDRVENIAAWGDHLESFPEFSPQDCWALRRGRLYQVGPNFIGLRCSHNKTHAISTNTLCIPLLAQGDTLGLFYLSILELPQPIQQLARTVAEQLSLALANLHLRETLQQQSIRDPLTRLFNRRYLEETLTREVQRAQRQHHTIGVIMLDIDHFKQFNDTYGHDAGDRVLETVGQLLRESVRGSDVACRYGGEEMILILPVSPPEATLTRAEEIRQALSLLQISYSGLMLNSLSASLGVASFPDHGLRAGDVLKAADDALYQAKAQGRNRVVVATVPAIKVADEASGPLPRDIS